MLLKGYLVFGMLVATWFTVAAASGWRLFPPAPPGVSTGGARGSGGSHPIWFGGK